MVLLVITKSCEMRLWQYKWIIATRWQFNPLNVLLMVLPEWKYDMTWHFFDDGASTTKFESIQSNSSAVQYKINHLNVKQIENIADWTRLQAKSGEAIHL